MRYQNFPDFEHEGPERLGVLLLNSGTPDSPAPRDVRRFLKNLLSDPRLIELPRALWLPLLHGVLLQVRPRASARKYRKVWTEQGSPLLTISEELAAGLREELARRVLAPFSVELGMLYGRPSVPQALERLRQAGARRVLVLPLFPQYSAVTTGASFDQVTGELRGWRWMPELRFVNEYHDHPAYIAALAQSLGELNSGRARRPHLLMSFHGLPQAYFDKGDPYYCKCQKTARLLAEELNLREGSWSISFQSKMGPGRWLSPYTIDRVRELARSGVDELTVVCPGFAVDCLETIEEIGVENRAAFLAAGGRSFRYQPALNARPAHARFLADLIGQHVRGWTPVDVAGLVGDRRQATAP